MQFNENFIGNEPNTILHFSGGDQEIMYRENLAAQPSDWCYRDIDITYEYNSYGHRCKNISEIDLSNYILFAGCSHTEGTGLRLEDTFAYLTAKNVNSDYYNLGIAGTGIDVMTYNLMTWALTADKLPKALVILWPHLSRFSLYNDGIMQIQSPVSATSDVSRFMVLGEDIGFFHTTQMLSERLISIGYKGCKIINLSHAKFDLVDLARDLSHAGINSNALLAEQLVNQL